MNNLLKENITGSDSKIKTIVDYSLKESNLFIKFICQDSFLYTPYDGLNNPVYEGCCVEVFLQEIKDRYLEIELAPNGAMFIAYIEVNEDGTRDIVYIDKPFHATIKLIDNKTYEAIIELHLDKYFKNYKNLKMNMYRIECREGEEQYLMALNPTLCNSFHVQDKFVELL